MSYKDNADLRVLGAGGWSYMEHELWTVFAPLIGPHGIAVYAAMCRLIPLAAVDPEKQVRVRRVSEYSCVSRSVCAEAMQVIFRLGMIVETKYLDGREPTYKIVKLRDLSRLGDEELKRRIGVRPQDTAPFDQEHKHNKQKANRSKLYREKVSATKGEPDLPLLDDKESASGDGVRDTDTSAEESAAKCVRPQDTQQTAAAEELASSGRTPVSARTHHVSATTHHVSAEGIQKRGPLLLGEEEGEERRKEPPTPALAGEEDPDDQAVPSLPVEHCTIGDAGFATSLGIAAQWVLQRLGINKRRLEAVIAGQLQLHCRQHRSVSLQDAARLAVANYEQYLADQAQMRFGPWGPAKFFGEGYWSKPQAWPYDQEKQRQAREASIGHWRPP